MKLKQLIFYPLLFLVTGFSASAADDTTLIIKTSVVCDMCEERIERELVFEKGVKEVSVDLKAKTVKIIYKTSKNTPEKIRKALAKLGYPADEIPADPKAWKKLPKCCREEGCGKN